ncbi:MAG TPA: DUF2330 domain-containing protein [Myxococcota bacterium]|nr:DUF2330 domain-containing protein [Myxococcota bacterium]
MTTLTLALWLADAAACGGLFCDAAQPVDQVGERILFIDLDGVIEVHVQISYQGPSEDFSWIVPVPAEPELLPSTDDVLLRLGLATSAVFQPTTADLGDCLSGFATRGGGPTMAMEDSAGGGEVYAPAATVTINQEVQVGPYDAQVLSANDAGVLVTWLGEHGYDLPDGAEARIAPYVASGSQFIGLRLRKDKAAGDLTPIAFRYPGDAPVIPLRLTAVAASDDMILQPLVLGPARAVPENYLHVVVNELAIDWINSGLNYLDVIRRAADEAGGQAFATDAAARVEDLEAVLWTPDLYPLDAIEEMTDATELEPLLMQLGYVSPIDNSWQSRRALPVSRGTVPILARFVPPPRGVDPFTLFQCLGCYVHEGQIPLDGPGLARALEEEWAAPLRHVQEQLDRSAWLTRMSSSMSADEMTVDPRFTFNPDLPAQRGAREATLEYDCRRVHSRVDAPRALVLPDGRRLELPSIDQASQMVFTWDSWTSEISAHAAERVEQTGRSGDPVVAVDNSAAIDDALAALNARVGCGCDASGGPWSALALLGALARRRRR